MAGITLTRSNRAGVADVFETIVTDSGYVSADQQDTLVITGNTAISTSAGASPKSVVINFLPEEVILGSLGDVDDTTLSDGYTLVYRTDGSSRWVAEPSTTTDEYVRVSNTDTSTGRLDTKITNGSNISLSIVNPGGNEQLQISSSMSVTDLTDTSISVLNAGDILVYGGSPSTWTNVPIDAVVNVYKTITNGTDSIQADSLNDTLQITGANGISVDVGSSGSPETDTVTIGIAGEINLSTINGQPVVTMVDSTRSKRLSISEQILTLTSNQVRANDWMNIGDAIHTDSGYIADMDGTIVFATGHCENTNTNAKEFHIFVNGIDQGSIGILSGGANATFVNTTLDIDFSQGDKIRVQAIQLSGDEIEDTILKITIKWRG